MVDFDPTLFSIAMGQLGLKIGTSDSHSYNQKEKEKVSLFVKLSGICGFPLSS
jgi:hypothetical protein